MTENEFLQSFQWIVISNFHDLDQKHVSVIEKPYRDHLVSYRISLSHIPKNFLKTGSSIICIHKILPFVRYFKNKKLNLLHYCTSKYGTIVLRNEAVCRETQA